MPTVGHRLMIRMKSRLFLRHDKLCKIKPDTLWGKLTDVRTKKIRHLGIDFQ